MINRKFDIYSSFYTALKDRLMKDLVGLLN